MSLVMRLAPQPKAREELHLQEIFAWITREQRPGEGLLRTLERIVVIAVVDTEKNVRRAARLLGVSTNTVYDKLKEVDRCGVKRLA